MPAPLTPLIVFCHLRFDFVYQRPQHLISRLAQTRRVLFIEEPMKCDGPDHWEITTPEPNLAVCRPRTSLDAPPHFNDDQNARLTPMVQQLLREQGIDEYVLWFYTPMALPIADDLDPRAVVYDCMDELSAFLHAPPQLLEREKQLLQRADVVFTGGPSLYRSKKDRHPNAHCFSSSVDAKHFGAAKTGGAAVEPDDQARLPHPRLGFYGVIDERFDIDILHAMATAHPEWQIMMVGPVVKIDPATLPKHPNIHYVGQKGYPDLPKYLAGWDVALLPFARNQSTKFISPTKTLEYMAAEKMIVSTPITDVAEPYGHIVYLGDTPEQFIQACEQALAANDAERTRRVKLMREVLARTSWDQTASRMNQLIEDAIEQRSRGGAVAPFAEPVREIVSAAAEPVVVIGAGPTGLSAAYHLGGDALLLEKNDTVGGWCRSIVDKGFTFDFAGHIMFSNDPYVHELYEKLLGDNVHWQDREAWIYSKNVYTRYPFQGCLYGLPADVITECIVGAIEARFGSLKQQKVEMEDAVSKAAQSSGAGQSNGNGNGNGHAQGNGHANGNGNGNGHSAGGVRGALGSLYEKLVHGGNGNPNGSGNGNGNGNGKGNGNGHHPVQSADASRSACRVGDVKDCCADGVMEAEVALESAQRASLGSSGSGQPKNFEEFIYKVWGRGIAKHFAIPYNRKLWAVDLKEMETSWLGGRVPMPDIEEMIKYSVTPACKPMGPNARFGYPLRGGFQALMNGFLPLLEGEMKLNTAVAKVSPARHTLTTADGEEVRYDHLISTMPLPLLIRSMGDEPPAAVRDAVKRLRYISVRCVNLGVNRENITDKHWIYYPEDSVFHRIFVQGNASPHCNPAGGFGITCEITYAPSKPLPCDGDALIQRCIDDCRKVKMFTPDDEVICANQIDMPFAYVVYDHGRAANVKIIRDWLLEQDIVLAGRYSEWEYYNSDHAFIAGKKAVEHVRERQRQRTSGVTA